MEWCTAQNQVIRSRSEIPYRDLNEFQKEISDYLDRDFRLIAFDVINFKENKDKNIKNLIAILANDDHSNLKIAATEIDLREKIPSLSSKYPSFAIFERILSEEHCIDFIDHPYLKPVREIDFPFIYPSSKELHQVGVGPVHAGIIEPGHFRFTCEGEKVLSLEISLGYQKRGVKQLLLKCFNEKQPLTRLFALAESIVGDSSVAYAHLFSIIIESLSNIYPDKRDLAIRGVFSEMERIAMHIADLSAIANDVAYLSTSAFLQALRTKVINNLLYICGSRFGRNFFGIGTNRFDFDDETVENMRKNLIDVRNSFINICDDFFSNSMIIARLENTSILTKEYARLLGQVGVSAKASGLPVDARSNHPYGIYRHFPIYPYTIKNGDVYSRAFIRYIEVQQSIKFILEVLDYFPAKERTDFEKPLFKMPELIKDSFCINIVEGFRGEIASFVVTDSNKDISDIIIVDPSVHNWYGLSVAIRNSAISDFPVTNKSFNLSYCGHDM
jgi:Ni,Fe-hydrogenase III large subunit/NADH:ubiquinone oxidoreductase subunit C